MENKQLNLSKPILSARRCSPPACQHSSSERSMLPPHYRSDLTSGPVGKQAAVPFHWEQIPGRPKEEMTLASPRPLAAPALPPGWYMVSRTESFSLNCSMHGQAAADENTAGPKPDLGLDNHGHAREGDGDSDQYRNLVTSCGLLSRLCLRNSSGFVNPIRVKMQSRCSSHKADHEVETGDASFGCPNKSFKMFRELLADPAEADSGSSIVEKTVYVDTVQEVAGIVRSPAECKDNEHNTKGMDHCLHSVDSSPEDLKKSNAIDGEGELSPDTQHDRGLTASEAATVKPNLHEKCPEFLVLPLLLKSPTDSWLWRTLPRVSAKTALQHSHLSMAASSLTYSSRAVAQYKKLREHVGVQHSENR